MLCASRWHQAVTWSKTTNRGTTRRSRTTLEITEIIRSPQGHGGRAARSASQSDTTYIFRHIPLSQLGSGPSQIKTVINMKTAKTFAFLSNRLLLGARRPCDRVRGADFRFWQGPCHLRTQLPGFGLVRRWKGPVNAGFLCRHFILWC